MVERAEDWAWSSVRAHLAEADDGLVHVAPALERYGCFDNFLGAPVDYADARRVLRRSETSGRPIGSADWGTALEAQTGRMLAPQKRGPKAKH